MNILVNHIKLQRKLVHSTMAPKRRKNVQAIRNFKNRKTIILDDQRKSESTPKIKRIKKQPKIIEISSSSSFRRQDYIKKVEAKSTRRENQLQQQSYQSSSKILQVNNEKKSKKNHQKSVEINSTAKNDKLFLKNKNNHQIASKVLEIFLTPEIYQYHQNQSQPHSQRDQQNNNLQFQAHDQVGNLPKISNISSIKIKQEESDSDFFIRQFSEKRIENYSQQKEFRQYSLKQMHSFEQMPLLLAGPKSETGSTSKKNKRFK